MYFFDNMKEVSGLKMPNLLIIAGTGTKSGKTSLACRLIGQFRHAGVIGIKITPHFHETTPGLELLAEGSGHVVFEEKNRETNKDTSRMLRAGAARVFYIKATDNTLPGAFREIPGLIPGNVPVVCESSALRLFVYPGLFVVMKHHGNENQKDIEQLLMFSHKAFTLDDLASGRDLPVGFSYGTWFGY